jgi:hypothetical protein
MGLLKPAPTYEWTQRVRSEVWSVSAGFSRPERPKRHVLGACPRKTCTLLVGRLRRLNFPGFLRAPHTVRRAY